MPQSEIPANRPISRHRSGARSARSRCPSRRRFSPSEPQDPTWGQPSARRNRASSSPATKLRTPSRTARPETSPRPLPAHPRRQRRQPTVEVMPPHLVRVIGKARGQHTRLDRDLPGERLGFEKGRVPIHERDGRRARPWLAWSEGARPGARDAGGQCDPERTLLGRIRPARRYPRSRQQCQTGVLPFRPLTVHAYHARLQRSSPRDLMRHWRPLAGVGNRVRN
jgi:hypothetical protein